jgi:hypothetical protein
MAEQFIVAVRRDSRGDIPPNWIDVIRHTAGVQTTTGNDRRLVVHASPDAMRQIQNALGRFLFIEQVIVHHAAR